MRDRELWFCLITILIANTSFMWLLADGALPTWLYNRGRFVILAGCLVITVWGFRGINALPGLVASLTVWRVSPWWYLFALAWPPTMCTLFLLAKGQVTGEGMAALAPTLATVGNWQMLKNLLIAALVGEIVWVSYAIGRLKQQVPVLLAAAIVGSFWTLWWAPMVAFGIGVIPDTPILTLWINMLGVAGMAAWVYTKSGSGLVVLCLQLAVNGSLLIFPVVPNTGGVPTYNAFAVTYFLAVLLVYAIAKPQAPRTKATPA